MLYVRSYDAGCVEVVGKLQSRSHMSCEVRGYDYDSICKVDGVMYNGVVVVVQSHWLWW